MTQLILHLLGDYVTQSDWMAQNKTKCSKAAAAHAIVYSLPFLLLQPSLAAFSVILITHFFIDRFRLARYVVWLKNKMGPREILHYEHHWKSEAKPRIYKERYDSVDWHSSRPIHKEMTVAPPFAKAVYSKRLSWENCSATGYPSETPPWMAVWLMIAADNTIHLAVNYAALRWL